MHTFCTASISVPTLDIHNISISYQLSPDIDHVMPQSQQKKAVNLRPARRRFVTWSFPGRELIAYHLHRRRMTKSGEGCVERAYLKFCIDFDESPLEAPVALLF